MKFSDLPSDPKNSAESCPATNAANSQSPAPPETVGMEPQDELWLKLADELEQNNLARTVPLHNTDGFVMQESVAGLLGTTIGKFRLEEELAQGGMGIIFRAVDLELNREVAVKLLLNRHSGKPQLRQQFTNEVRITSRLQHPGIIPIYQMGETEDARPFFAMKLVTGKSFSALLAARANPDENLPRMLKVFEQICQTLSYTHARGVIHLDIKPENVMVGEFGEVQLMDWGLARTFIDLCPATESSRSVSAGNSQTAQLTTQLIPQDDLRQESPSGVVWGTPAYMSPEQARGQNMDVRSDVFGLGGILFEILTGSPPYQGTSLVDVCFKAAGAELDHALETLARTHVDDTLKRLTVSCLSGNPFKRPRDAGVVAREITLYLETQLRRAESDLERFFDLSLDLFCIAGLDGFFRRVNSNFPRVLGYTEKELISRPFLDFVHPEDREGTINVMSALKIGKPVVQFKNRYLAANGTWRCFEWTAKSIPDEGIIFAVARDMSSQQSEQLQQSV